MSNLNIPGSWRFQQSSQLRAGFNVQIDLSPNLLRLSENPSFYRLQYTQVVVPNGGIAQMTFRVIGNVLEGSVFSIANSQYTVTLTGSSTPSFNQFYTVTGDTSFLMRQRVAESLAYELQNHPLFGLNYDVRAESDFVYITAVDSGASFSLGLTPPSNITLVSNSPGGNLYPATGLIDYSTFVDVHVGNWSYGQTVDRFNSEKVDSLIMPFSPPNLPFDVAGSVKDSTNVPLPRKLPSQNFLPYQIDKTPSGRILVPYFLLFGDSFRYLANGSKKLSTTGVTAIRWVQNGALGELESYDLMPYTTAVTLSNNVRMLSYSPSVKHVERSTHNYIQFIMSEITGAANVGLSVEVTFKDGSTVSYDSGSILAVGLGGNLSIDVSQDIVGVPVQELIAGKVAKSYRVRFWHQRPSFPRVYSEWTTYEFKDKCHKPKMELIWFNSLGAWDSYTLTVQGKTNSTESKSFNRAVPFNQTQSYELDYVYQKESQDTVRANAVLDKEHYLWFKELLKSTSVFQWDSSISRYRPLILVSSDYDTDFVGMKELNLEFRLQEDNTVSK
jgi:hypothetical protein